MSGRKYLFICVQVFHKIITYKAHLTKKYLNLGKKNQQFNQQIYFYVSHKLQIELTKIAFKIILKQKNHKTNYSTEEVVFRRCNINCERQFFPWSLAEYQLRKTASSVESHGRRLPWTPRNKFFSSPVVMSFRKKIFCVQSYIILLPKINNQPHKTATYLTWQISH